MSDASCLASARRHIIHGWVLVAATAVFVIYLLLHDSWPLAALMAALSARTIYGIGYLRGMLYLAEDDQ